MRWEMICLAREPNKKLSRHVSGSLQGALVERNKNRMGCFSTIVCCSFCSLEVYPALKDTIDFNCKDFGMPACYCLHLSKEGVRINFCFVMLMRRDMKGMGRVQNSKL